MPRLRERLQDDFHRIMYAIEMTAEELPQEERADVYRFAIEAVCMELVATRNTAVWRFRDDECANMDFPIPFSCQIGESHEKYKDCRSRYKYLMSCTASTQKLAHAIKDIRSGGFNRELGVYEINYYPEIDFAVALNGMHHLAVAAIQDVADADTYLLFGKGVQVYDYRWSMLVRER